MRLSCSREALSRGLQIVGRGIGSGTGQTLPVLSNVLMATDDGRLRLSATDLKVGITVWIPAMILQDGAITLPARLFTDCINNLQGEQVDLATGENGMVTNVRSGRTSANIRGIDADEFPLIPTIAEEPAATIAAGTLRGMINQVVFAASTDSTRGPLVGVFTSFSGSTLTMAASDGYRLSQRIGPLATPCTTDFSVLIPGRTVAEFGRILPEDDTPVDVTVTPNRSQILFHMENLDFLATLLNDQFIPYQRYIRSEYKTRVVLSTAELQKAVKLASIFAKDNSSLLNLVVEPGSEGAGTVTVSAATQDLGDNKSVVDGIVEGNALQIGFNSKYVADALGVMNSQQVALELMSATHAGILRPVDGADFLHVIMPVNVPR